MCSKFNQGFWEISHFDRLSHLLSWSGGKKALGRFDTAAYHLLSFFLANNPISSFFRK
jgi:hypothetical protein